MSSFAEHLTVAMEAARQAGGLLVESRESDFQISKKGRINLVTEMDLRSEEILVEKIGHHFPGHQILAEEEGLRKGEPEYLWVIDPLDGTTNYAHGYRFFCVSIALQAHGQTVLGVVYDPVTDEMFTAIRGQGAKSNGRPIRVTQEDQLSESLISTGFSYQEEGILENLRLFNHLIMKARAVRRDGSAALDLCYVACGRFDGFWELHLSPWDVAAGMLLVEEAGGKTSRFDGSACTIHDRELLATNGRVHAAMTRELQRANPGASVRQRE